MKIINIIGSSSCRFFFKGCKNLNKSNTISEIYTNTLFNNLKFNGLIISGISIYGLENEKSKTNSKEEINSFLNNYKSDLTIFYIGKVDLEFLIWYRNQKYNENIDDLLIEIVSKLKILLSKYDNNKLIFICPPLPTVDDDHFIKLLEKYNSLPKYSGEEDKNKKNNDNILNHKDRTEMTIKFNNLIKDNINCKIIDINKFMFDKNTGIIKQQFLLNDKMEHHLNENHDILIISELNKILNFIDLHIPEPFGTKLYLLDPDSYSDIYHKKNNYSWNNCKDAINYIENYIKIKSYDCKTLIDIGCSDGYWTNLFNRYIHSEGEDKCENAIIQAKQKYSNINFYTLDSLKCNKKYDIVFCKGPAFFNEPVNEDFIKNLEIMLKRTNKIFIFTMYTTHPYNKRVSRSYFHDPELIKELLSKYGKIKENIIFYGNYFTIIINKY